MGSGRREWGMGVGSRKWEYEEGGGSVRKGLLDVLIFHASGVLDLLKFALICEHQLHFTYKRICS